MSKIVKLNFYQKLNINEFSSFKVLTLQKLKSLKSFSFWWSFSLSPLKILWVELCYDLFSTESGL